MITSVTRRYILCMMVRMQNMIILEGLIVSMIDGISLFLLVRSYLRAWFSLRSGLWVGPLLWLWFWSLNIVFMVMVVMTMETLGEYADECDHTTKQTKQTTDQMFHKETATSFCDWISCATNFIDNTLPGRLELPTFKLTASRSNQLNYGSRYFALKNTVVICYTFKFKVSSHKSAYLLACLVTCSVLYDVHFCLIRSMVLFLMSRLVRCGWLFWYSAFTDIQYSGSLSVLSVPLSLVPPPCHDSAYSCNHYCMIMRVSWFWYFMSIVILITIMFVIPIHDGYDSDHTYNFQHDQDQ